MQTGDLVFARSRGLLGWVILIGTAGLSALVKNKWVPTHVGILNQAGKTLWVHEATTHRGGEARVPLAVFMKRYGEKNVRFVSVGAIGRKRLIKSALIAFAGTPYERWVNMPAVAFDANKGGPSRLFCSELAVRVLAWAGVLWAKILDPNNTDPEELYHAAVKAAAK
jgi:hypothetical protein